MFYENQLEASEDVLTHFVRDDRRHIIRHVIMTAYMQSGKTGTYHRIIKEMLERGIVQNVVILCGMADNSLYNQSIQDANQYNREYVQNGKIQIYYNNHFKRARLPTRNVLYVIDESERDSTKDSLLHKMANRHGIPLDGDNEILSSNNMYILSVSATPFAEYCDSTVYHHSKPKAVVKFRPGDGYIGIKEAYEQNRIREIFNIREYPTRFGELINGIGNKYNFIRYDIRSYNFSLFEQFARENDWTIHVVRCNYSGYPEEEPYQIQKDRLTRILQTEPSKPTLILIHGSFRAGFVLPTKLHIGLVWENSKLPRTDTLVQGLPGRVCGYEHNTNPTILFYVSPESIGTNEIEKFIHYHEREYSFEYPRQFNHSYNEYRETSRNTTQPFRIPNDFVRRHLCDGRPNTVPRNDIVLRCVIDLFESRDHMFRIGKCMTIPQYEEIRQKIDQYYTREDREYTTLSNLITIRNGTERRYENSEQVKIVQKDAIRGFSTTSNWGIRRDTNGVNHIVPIVVVAVYEDYPLELQDPEEYRLNQRRNEDMPEGYRISYYVFFRTESEQDGIPTNTNGKEQWRSEHQVIHPEMDETYQPPLRITEPYYRGTQLVVEQYTQNPHNPHNDDMNDTRPVHEIPPWHTILKIRFHNPKLDTLRLLFYTLFDIAKAYTLSNITILSSIDNPYLFIDQQVKNNQFERVKRFIERRFNIHFDIRFSPGRVRRDGTRQIKHIRIH